MTESFLIHQLTPPQGRDAILVSWLTVLESSRGIRIGVGRASCSPVVIRPGPCVPGEWRQPHHRQWSSFGRSAPARTCVVPRTHNTFGNRSFGPAARAYGTVCHPTCVRTSATNSLSERLLEIFLFGSLLITAHRDYFAYCALEIFLLTN